MATQNKLKIIRKLEVLDRVPFSSNTLYTRISQKLFVPSISLGERAVGWVNSEVDIVTAAMIAGKSNDEIRIIVSDLIAKRQNILGDLK